MLHRISSTYPAKFLNHTLIHILISVLVVLLTSYAALANIIYPPSITLIEYRTNLQSLLTLIREAKTGTSSSLAQARQAAAPLASATIVMPDGSRVTADNRWLSNALAESTPDYNSIEQKLVALLRELDRAGAPAKIAHPDKAQQLLERVLERPQFQHNRDRSLADVFFEYLLDTLLRILRQGAPGGGPNILVILTGVVLTVVIGSILLLVSRNMIRAMNRSASEKGFTVEEAALTAQQAWRKAEELARTGDRRTAVRYLYLSALLYLDEKDIVVFDRSKTNREYLQTITANNQIFPLLNQIVNVFDRVWYGGLLPDDAEYAAFTEQVRRIKELPGA